MSKLPFHSKSRIAYYPIFALFISYNEYATIQTFNAAGIHIAVQAVLALASTWLSSKVEDRSLTGTVIDSGDGVTHVIPVVRPAFTYHSALGAIPSEKYTQGTDKRPLLLDVTGRRVCHWIEHQAYPRCRSRHYGFRTAAPPRPRRDGQYPTGGSAQSSTRDQGTVWLYLLRYSQGIYKVRC